MRDEERILIVHRDSKARHAIASVLEDAGHQVSSASDSEIAKALIVETSPALVVLDLDLSSHAPDEVASLRAMSRVDDTRILVLSAAGNEAFHRSALEAGVDDFLTKPVHRSELLLRARALLLLRRTQQELRTSNALLKQERDALMRAQRQNEELMELVVHDLKNPLAAITANASFIATARTLDHDAREAAVSIELASDNMLRMVQNLLELSRAENGQPALRRELVDMSAVVQQAVRLMSRRAQERQIELEVTISETELSVRGDADLLRRAVENLLDNAIRYTSSGGRIVSSCVLDGAELALSVADQGPGIPFDQRARVFEKYARLERHEDNLQRRASGGLGLTFVKLVADSHGGSVQVKENAPRGATFEIRLPCSPGRQANDRRANSR
jgi:signal transduction histidine kinase